MNSKTELTFDEYVAALVTIQLKRKMSNHSLQDIKELLEIENDDIDMGIVSRWLEENDIASINYSEFGDAFFFAMDGDSLEYAGNELVKRKFKGI
jgi:hypothetical protein